MRLNTIVLKIETITETFILFLQKKRCNIWVFLNVNMVLIYVTTWCNEEMLTKSQTF